MGGFQPGLCVIIALFCFVTAGSVVENKHEEETKLINVAIIEDAGKDTMKDAVHNGQMDDVVFEIDMFTGNDTDDGGWSTTDTIITCVVIGVVLLIVLPIICFVCQLYTCFKCLCCCCTKAVSAINPV